MLKNLWKKIRFELIWRALWFVSTAIGHSVRMKAVGEENLRKMVADGKGGVIVLWHGATMLPIFYCRNLGFWTIISTSADGELQNRLLQSRGHHTIRGSSGAHGVRAFVSAVKHAQKGEVIALTPDGPKGPVKVVQHGSVLLAERSGCPVIPIGIACEPCKRLHSWDSHMIPMPFAKAVVVFGAPFDIPKTSTDEEREIQAQRIADAINAADAEAERILKSGGK